MLQRMDELATKAANGTQSQGDRQNIQDEMDQLLTEIDRVSETTKFNETYLLRGTSNADDGKITNYLSAKTAGINGTFEPGDNSSVLNADTKTSVNKATFKITDDEWTKISNLKAGDTYDIGGTVYSIVSTGSAGATLGATQIAVGGTNKVTTQIVTKMTEALTKANAIGSENGTAGTVAAFDNAKHSWEITKATVQVVAKLSLSLHVGADSTATNKIDLQIDKMNTRGLGIEGLKVTGTSAQNATFAIDAISDAINRVSSQRSALGAVQNRLEHTIKNVDNVIENTQSAESAIRDTDMASEMVKFSNAQILQQAGQSMLAQANQSNQGVLSLLG
jgi:flagellin